MPVSAITDTLTLESCGQEHIIAKFRDDVCLKLSDGKFRELSIEDQKQAILAIITAETQTIYDKLDFARKWNNQMTITEKPADIETHSGTYISDAWMSMDYLQDSYYYGGAYYTDGNAELGFSYDYTLSKPADTKKTNTCSCSSLTGKSCGSTYTIDDESTITIIDAAGNHVLQLSAGDEYNYDISAIDSDNNELSLEIINHIIQKNFVWQSGSGSCSQCCKSFLGSCIRRAKPYTCTYYNQENHYYRLNNGPIEYSFATRIQESYPESYTLDYTDRYIDPIINFSTQTPEYKLYLGKASLQKGNYSYIMNYTHPPYNFLFVQKVDKTHAEKSDMDILDNTDDSMTFKTSPANLQACVFEVQNPFNKKQIKCNPTCEYFTPQINLTTDHSVYEDEDKIQLNISIIQNNLLPSGTAKITYGDSSEDIDIDQGKGFAELTPIIGNNLIQVEFDGAFSKKTVYSYDPHRYTTLGIFAFSLFFLFILYKAAEHIALRRML